ncbi:MAG: hypothetical protein WCF33_11615 [Pseudonocardiaceae bacterium]
MLTMRLRLARHGLAALVALALLPVAAVTANAAAAAVSSTPTSPIPSVGKLFTHAHGFSDSANCTGTVLNTPKHDIVLTAKHCTRGIGKFSLAYFAPGYDMSAKYGEWKIKGAYDGPGDLEVLVIDKNNGKNIQDVVGGQNYGIDIPIGGPVSIIGYPSSDGHGRPYYCGADATVHVWKGHPNEWQTDCGKNFNAGVSGSAYMVNYNPQTHQGTVVAALGGDDEGSAGPGGEFSLGDPLTGSFNTFLQDVLKKHA